MALTSATVMKNALGSALGPGGAPIANDIVNLLTGSGTGIYATGAPAGTNVSVEERGAGGSAHNTRLTFTSRSITMTDEAGVVAYGGTKIYDFPAGVVRIRGVSVNLTVTKSGSGINADFDGDWSLGTATASNNATLTSTEQDVIASTATTQAVAGVTTVTKSAMATITALTDNSGGTASNTLAAIEGSYTEATIENTVASLAAKINELIAANVSSSAKSFDGTSTAKDLYLNFLIDDADQDGGGALLVTGTIDLFWDLLGDV